MLRAIEEGDLLQLMQWRNHPNIRKYLRHKRELTIVDQAKWFESLSGDMTRRMYAICNEKGNLLGCCGLTEIDWMNRSAEVSLYVGNINEGEPPIYIDETIAPDVLGQLMEIARKEMNIHRLWVEVYSYDTQKQKLCNSLSYDLEGTLHHTHFWNGDYQDSLIYSYIL